LRGQLQRKKWAIYQRVAGKCEDDKSAADRSPAAAVRVRSKKERLYGETLWISRLKKLDLE
jgi:hypothetical protein